MVILNQISGSIGVLINHFFLCLPKHRKHNAERQRINVTLIIDLDLLLIIYQILHRLHQVLPWFDEHLLLHGMHNGIQIQTSLLMGSLRDNPKSAARG